MAFTSDADAAIKQIAAEKGIPVEKVYAALKDAILVAYKKEYFKDGFNEEEDNLSVEMNSLSDGFKIIAKKTVVKKVENELREISLEQAKQVSKDLKVGDVVEVELPVDAQEFGRIAAQTAKQVLLQKNREFEKEAILEEFSGKIGQVFSALMQRMQRGSAIFEIGKASAIMPVEEQIPNEFYKVGERYKVLLKDIIDTPNGKELVVSRADPDFLIELFKMEVPEIESGVVEVKAVAREAGSRSKMAVSSNQDGVDPIGSCVGQRGIRIANVMSELGEEKIDIIEWDDNIEKFVANALSPAKVESVKVKGETATVKVAEDQLSLAIGREGQNARLAWKLTTKKVDILG
ncbi:MAG TPA: transcription termination factor NusA, partial [Candidatus Dojkabacteria bacterium]|nr:transcription termination factor NusA [Candidatus Dojkabacteria bacterium]